MHGLFNESGMTSLKIKQAERQTIPLFFRVPRRMFIDTRHVCPNEIITLLRSFFLWPLQLKLLINLMIDCRY